MIPPTHTLPRDRPPTLGSATPDPRAPHVVLVEDDDILRDHVVAPGLRSFGFRVTAVGTASGLQQVLAAEKPDIVVLDVCLPDGDGFALAEFLYMQSSIGIVMLSGRYADADRVRALSNGADAYLAKPVVMSELAATLRNLMRRLRPAMPTTPAQQTPPRWRLDQKGWSLLAPNGTAVPLKAHERTMLTALFDVPGTTVSREALIRALGGDELFDPHRLDVLVYRLRTKVGRLTGLMLPLAAVRGSGYVFTV